MLPDRAIIQIQYLDYMHLTLQSQIRPAPHFNTLLSPLLSYGAFLAAFIHFSNGHSPIILNHL